MSQEGTLSIASSDGSSVKATMWFGPTRVKESSIWLLYLLKTPGFLERCVFKQNTLGRVKLTLTLKKRLDWLELVQDTKLTVAQYLTSLNRNV